MKSVGAPRDESVRLPGLIDAPPNSGGQIDERAMELDEFQLTEIICNSMPGDITLEDLPYTSKSELYRMCYDELVAAM